jgi:hypothetical protein
VPTYPYRSPEWWVDRLSRQLDKRRPAILRLNEYYGGNHPLPEAPPKAQREYRDLLRKSRSNWMALVVDAVGERLKVNGIRFAGDEEGDTEVWASVWQANNLDAEAQMVQTDALVCGSACVTVWPDENAQPLIQGELPEQMIVAYEPGFRRKRAAALKAWVEDDEHGYVTLYLPDAIYKYVTRTRIVNSAATVANWRFDNRDVAGENWPLENVLETVNVIELQANPRSGKGGRSELDGGVTDIQDRINETIFNRAFAEKFAAFRQRWVTGMAIPTDPETGELIEPFRAAVDRLWMAEDAEAKFGEFSESDLKGYIAAVESDIQHLAAITRTPPHYLLGQSGAFPSGDSLKATETGLVAKVRKHQIYFGEAWEEMFRLGLTVLEDKRAEDTAAEILWRDPEARTEGELVDSLVKMATLGVPFEVLWKRWGASPLEVKQWRDRLDAAKKNQPPPATGG